MSVMQKETAALLESSGIRPYLWTVERFYRALSAGLFEHPERLELIKGEIIERMSPQDTPHSTATLLTRDLLADLFRALGHVRSQMPLDLFRDTEPEPDVFVVKRAIRDYETRKLRPSDLLLLEEVSDSTLAYDRGVKASLYAEAGERFGFGYHSVRRYAETESVAPLAAPDAPVRVEDLLPNPVAKTGS